MSDGKIGIVIGGIMAIGTGAILYKLLKEESKEPEVITVMKEKLVYFQDKGEEFKEIADKNRDILDTSKKVIDEGIIDVATKINTAVGTINELRDMMGREPSTLGTYDLDALKAKIDAVIEPVVTEPINYVRGVIGDKYIIR